MAQEMIARARKARGDVAQSAQANPALQKMMEAMTLQGILKQAGDIITADQIKELNAKLQDIPKV